MGDGINERNALRDVTRNAPDTDTDNRLHEEEEELRLRTLPDELRDNWGKAYQFLCVKDPSATYVEVMAKFKRQAGITDRLIVHLIETAIKTKRRNFLAWVAEVLTECAANDITTPEGWVAFDKGRQAQEQQAAAERETAKQATRRPDKPRSQSTVFLQRPPKDEKLYGQVFKDFGDGKGG